MRFVLSKFSLLISTFPHASPSLQCARLLPDGIHKLDDLRERCVDEFPQSATRADIFASFVRYCQLLQNLGLSLMQWIDGSFVDRTRLNPSDIDIVNFCESALFRKLSLENRNQASSLLGDGNPPGFGYQIHSFLVMTFDYDVAGYAEESEIKRHERRHYFSQPLDYSDPQLKRPAPYRGSKGIVEIALNDVTIPDHLSR